MKVDPKGFAMLEILVATAISGVVLAAIYLMWVTNQTTFAWGETRIEIQQNGRLAVEMMAREIRMVGYDPSNVIPSCAQPTAIQGAGPDSITFIADVTGDMPTPISDRVTYRLSGSQIIRDFSTWSGAGCGWNPNIPSSSALAENVSGFAFQYFDASDAPVPSPIAAASLSNIRRITIGVTTQGAAAGRQQTFPLTMDVRLRNLR